MQNDQNLLQGHTDDEKTAYLGAIASIATADRQASDTELQYLATLCDSANLSEEQKDNVLSSASSSQPVNLQNYLDVLKGSDLKHSLVTDLITFAKSDSDYSEAEQQSIKNIASYLQVNDNQYALLEELSDKAQNEDVSSVGNNFLGGLGIEDKLKSAGINTGSLLKGLVAVAAPIIISKMMHRNTQATQTMQPTNNGNIFGGSGGLGNIFGNNNSGGSGGLGSIISMLNGGGGFGKAGSLLGSLFK